MGLERDPVCSRGSSVNSNSSRSCQWMSSAVRPGSRMGTGRGRGSPRPRRRQRYNGAGKGCDMVQRV